MEPSVSEEAAPEWLGWVGLRRCFVNCVLAGTFVEADGAVRVVGCRAGSRGRRGCSWDAWSFFFNTASGHLRVCYTARRVTGGCFWGYANLSDMHAALVPISRPEEAVAA